MVLGKRGGVIALVKLLLLGLMLGIMAIPLASASSVLVTSEDSNTISLVDTISGDVKNVSLEGGPGRVALSTDKKTAFIIMSKDNSIVFFDLKNFRESSRINIGRKPSDLLVVNNKLYVINSNSNELVEVDLESKTISRRLDIGKSPVRLNTFGENKLITSDESSRTLSVIDLAKWEVSRTITLSGKPGALASNTDGSKIYFIDTENKELVELEVNSNNDYLITNKSFQVSRVTSSNDLVVGNKFALLSANIGYKGEIQVINLDEGSWESISIENRVSSFDMENGVIYVASGKDLIMLNKETNIKRDFKIGSDISGVQIINETYVPIGDIDITEEDKEIKQEIENSKVPFPWKRLGVLFVILIILGLFLRRSTKLEEKEEVKNTEPSENQNNTTKEVKKKNKKTSSKNTKTSVKKANKTNVNKKSLSSEETNVGEENSKQE